ncbi:MAG: protocatechuate 3,4-dioxygenase subunit alpha [Roseobacter sp.]|jgi:protocatechuate 3,4-dioxygenase alpha subunit
MTQRADRLRETPSQTAGPYVHIGLTPASADMRLELTELGIAIAGPGVSGERIRVSGAVFDGTGAPVKDYLIEIWQADSKGTYAGSGDVDEGFTGWGRVAPDFGTGDFSFDTVKPGPVLLDDGRSMAPHLNLWLVARGINIGLNTRMYFGDESDANAADPVLQMIEQEHRRKTLIAQKSKGVYRFDIFLQGSEETVFFDV